MAAYYPSISQTSGCDGVHVPRQAVHHNQGPQFFPRHTRHVYTEADCLLPCLGHSTSKLQGTGIHAEKD